MSKAGGIFLLAGGAALAYWVKKRQFERTNNAGGKPFKNYSNMVAVTAVEKAVWWIGLTCVVLGAILLL